MRGSKMPTPQRRFERNQGEGDGQHRRSQDEDQAGRVHRPDEKRQAKPSHAGRTELVHRDDEVESGKDGREAVNKNAHGHGDDPSVRVGAAVGRVECPPGVDAAEDDGGEREQAAEHEDVPADQVQARKGHVARADHDGDEEISEHVGDRRDQEEPNHDHAVQSEQFVVGRGGEELAVGLGELDTHEHGRHAADEEEECDGGEIKQRDAFVIVGEKPRGERLLLVEIALLRKHGGLGILGHG